jgi:hypothetical protein
MSEAIKMRLISPEVGPNGLVTSMPDSIHPITLADVFEVLRWVHSDLKHIHRSFGYIEGVRRELGAIKVIHHKQEVAYAAQAERHAELLRMLEAQSQLVLDQAQEIAEQHRAIDAMESRLELMQEHLVKPWWKKLWPKT